MIIPNQDRLPAIALVGCGAIADSFYMPALVKYKDLYSSLILVDTNEEQAAKLAENFGIAKVAVDYQDIIDEVDGAIIAVPHNFHFPIAMNFVSAGKHVLCEKPLVERSEEAQMLIEKSQECGVHVMGNYTRRLFPAYGEIKAFIERGELGEIVRIEYAEGGVFNWPTSSGFYFKRGNSPQGVLMDRGPHVLDLICWWLGGRPDVLSCFGDAAGGNEAVTQVEFARGGATGLVKLSWLSRLANRFSIYATKATLHGDIYDWHGFDVESAQGQFRRVKTPGVEKSFFDFGNRLIENFMSIITGVGQPLVSAYDVIHSIAMIEESYSKMQSFQMAWDQHWINPAKGDGSS